jgi:hypothetical protein
MRKKEYCAKTISATEEDFKYIREIGNGSLTLGVRRAVSLWKHIESSGNVKIDKEHFGKDRSKKK